MKKIVINKDKLQLIDDKKRSLTELVYIFVICAMIGWCVEVGFVYLNVGKFTDRGMMYGPFCSIYGFGASILYLLFYNLKPSKANIPYAFIVSSVFMGAFELICGLGFKYILNIEMWNYHGRFLAILDYTTVPILIGWGILGTMYIFLLQPFLQKIISFIPKFIVKRLALTIVIAYFLDFAFSAFNIHVNPEILQKLVDP